MIGMVKINSMLSFICDFCEKTLMAIETEAFCETLENLKLVLTQLRTT